MENIDRIHSHFSSITNLNKNFFFQQSMDKKFFFSKNQWTKKILRKVYSNDRQSIITLCPIQSMNFYLNIYYEVSCSMLIKYEYQLIFDNLTDPLLASGYYMFAAPFVTHYTIIVCCVVYYTYT